ncbi:MAG: hypothetical protein JO329_07485 [Planctomycetaceae bacterium]|nr:hypothetical protein [Planctomycetaceae bacterium]MBV8316211.1 hypothetical protein [Planctomycetaceae bacterium]
MGKPYDSELGDLPRTYEWARTVDIDALAASIRRYAEVPLVAVGSGGSLTSAYFACLLHSLYTGRLARPMTPYELVGSPVHLGGLGVLFLTARGGNPDILDSFDIAVRRVPRRIGLLCTRTGSPLVTRAADVAGAEIHEFDLPTIKDGFLATNSLLATSVLLARAYQLDPPSSDSLASRFEELVHPGQSGQEFHADLSHRCRALWDRPTTLVLHGQTTQPAAIDLESKFTEAALGHLQLADYRNFAHGRYHWLAKHGEGCAVLSLASADDVDLAEKTLGLLPGNIPKARLQVENGVSGSLKALALSLFIAGLAGRARVVDPGRPRVPAFGRKLYHLGGAYRVRAVPRIGEAEAVAITRKAGASIRTLSAQGTLQRWRQAYALFTEQLCSTPFKAIVLDYDGTLCDASERYSCLSCGVRPAAVSR